MNVRALDLLSENTYDRESDQLSNRHLVFTLNIGSFPFYISLFTNYVKFLQAACARLSAAEIALFIHGDPAAIDYRAASLQEQVQAVMINCDLQKK